MIATNIAANQEGALVFGLVTTTGAGVVLVVGLLAPTRRGIDEVAAHELEREIAELAAVGVDERRLRRVVTLARRLGAWSPEGAISPQDWDQASGAHPSGKDGDPSG